MEFFTDMLGGALGSLSQGGFSDTLHDANGAFAGQLVHGLGGNPDLLQNSLGQTIGQLHHDLGGREVFDDAFGHTKLVVEPGLGGNPALLHDGLGHFVGSIQPGLSPWLPNTLKDSNWQAMAQSFGIQELGVF